MRREIVRLRPRADTNYISQGRLVFAVDKDGIVSGQSDYGLYSHQTRLLSRYRYLIDGRAPRPVALSNVQQYSWLGYYITVPPGVDAGPRDQGSGQVQSESIETLELCVARYAGGGLHEDLDFTNYTQQTTQFYFAIELDGDFADPEETGRERQQQGEIKRRWRTDDKGRWQLELDYHAQHSYHHQGETGVAEIRRGLTVRIEHAAAAPQYRDHQIVFHITLPAQGRWHACINMLPRIEEQQIEALYDCRSFTGLHNDYDIRRELFLSQATTFATPESGTLSAVVVGALEQAKRDLAALRLYDLDHGERAWTMAAGLPIYIALFGRDTLTAAWQAALTGTDMLSGTLYELARHQGREVNDWRDEQPGRMLHEAHSAPLAMLNYNPRRRYYGAATTSGFYPVAVTELWHWTGDENLVRPLVEPALKALAWLDNYADADGDGFYEYRTRSQQGVRNQGWKDSSDAIVYPDGRQVAPPIATCEEQAFVYLAKLHMSEMLWCFGDKERARRLYHEAGELKKRFNDRFWHAESGFLAMALDAEKRPVASAGSNAGHCLAAGIVDEALARQTADRLLERDLFSGWGVRTLSDQHPAYNPYSYHRGSVWPVEQGTFALGMMRYGLHDHIEVVTRTQFESAALFDFYRLPEVFSGHPRDDTHPFPALYAKANWPQAWSSSVLFCSLQALLGLYPYAPLNLLLVDPHLPEWLPEITVADLHVGAAAVTLHFWRGKNGRSDYRILDQQGKLHIFRQPSPWSLTATFGERLKDLLASLLPGR